MGKNIRKWKPVQNKVHEHNSGQIIWIEYRKRRRQIERPRKIWRECVALDYARLSMPHNEEKDLKKSLQNHRL
jgi:hypothetical protein